MGSEMCIRDREDGLVLSITSCQEPGNEIIRVRLEGTKFHAEITAGNEPSAEESGQLAHFFANAASVKTGQSLSWLSSCQDLLFTVSSESEFENYIFLRVYIGSNTNDECDWRVNADLLLRPEQLYHFALAVPLLQR